MTREEKDIQIKELTEKLSSSQFFYLTDSSTLNVETTNNLRELCYEAGIEMRVVKNTLVKKAMEQCEQNFEELYDSLVGPTAIMFTETSNGPAKLIKKFRENADKPEIKAAFIDSDVYVGDDQLEALASLKSKEELIGEVLTLLQSPMQNVLSALKSSEQNLAGVLKTLSEREEN